MKTRTNTFAALLFVVSVFLISACSDGATGMENGKGTVYITVGGGGGSGNSRAVWLNASTQSTMYYDITLSGGPGGPHSLTGLASGQSADFTVQAGTWNVCIDGRDGSPSGLKRAEGKATITVVANQTSNAQPVKMEPFLPNGDQTDLIYLINHADSGAEIRLPAGTISIGAVISITSNITLTTQPGATVVLLRDWVGSPGMTAGLFYINTGGDLTLKVDSGGSLTLDGNKTAYPLADDPLIRMDGGIVNMEDGVSLINNQRGYGAPGGAVTIAGGTFNMNGGTIHDNETPGGGGGRGAGVYVGSGGIFNMGGNAKIYNNIADTNGGGVHINGGTFKMEGSAKIYNNEGYTGGGIYVIPSAPTVVYPTISILDSSTVYGNTSNNSTTGYDGAVYIDNGTFTLYAKTAITNNNTPGSGSNCNVTTTSTTFKMPDGTLYNPADFNW